MLFRHFRGYFMETTMLQSFFLNLIAYFIDFFILELFTTTFFPYKHKYQYTYIRIIFMCICLTVSSISFIPTFIIYLVEFLYIAFISSYKWKKSIFFYCKYKIFYYVSYIMCAFISSTINQVVETNVKPTDTYFFYQTIINTTFVFILLNLFVYHKKLKHVNKKNIFSFHFSLFALSSIILLLYYNRFLLQNQELSNTFSYIFIFVVGVTIFNTYNYRKLIDLTDEQIQQKVLLEKYSMELDYINDVNESLKTLSKIRHDFKNHLIILDGYAQKNEIEKQREYIKKLNETIIATKIFDTTNNVVSSVLNTKNAICEKHGIKLNVNHQFQHISMDDFTMIIILGNILDNAITAAQKTKQGIIDLSIIQLGTYLEITCTNNHCGNIVERNGKLLTTKKHEKGSHGFGVGNIKEAVENLHGNVDLMYDQEKFCIKLLIPNHSPM